MFLFCLLLLYCFFITYFRCSWNRVKCALAADGKPDAILFGQQHETKWKSKWNPNKAQVNWIYCCPFYAVRVLAAIKIVVAIVVDVLVFFTSLMAYILRRLLTCMCWAQKFGILIFACFCFLSVVLCFSGPCCSCSVSTVNFCWILFLYFYSANWFYFVRHVAEAETRDKYECFSSSKAEPRTIFTSNIVGVREWVGAWLRFVYVHLSGFNVRSSQKRGLLFSIWFLWFPAFALRLCAVSVFKCEHP